MTLGRVVLAWLLVAAWFVLIAYGRRRFSMPSVGPEPAPPSPRLLQGGTPLLAEAGVLTLIGSLWFDSLGHGEWWLLFLLFGALVAVPGGMAASGARRQLIARMAFDCGRYVVAGAILSWSLA